MAIALVIGLVGAGAFAYFSDTETSSGNTLTAGTLDVKVDGEDDGATVASVTLSNMKPGDMSVYYKWVIKNYGNIPGTLSVTFSPIANNENGVVEPEIVAEAQPYASAVGELGQYLKPGIEPWLVEGIPGVTIIERNDEEGWWIATVDGEIDTGGSCGWGPKGWSVPSTVISQWQAGPPHPWGTPGLNGWGGKTFTYGTLNPGAEIAFFLRVKLDSDVQRWDGTKWLDVDDNIIQSDGVQFDIAFQLNQIP